MQNTMRAHSAGQISIEGGVDVNKGHMVYRGYPIQHSWSFGALIYKKYIKIE